MIAIVGDVAVQQDALHAFHDMGANGAVKPWEKSGHLDGWGIAACTALGPQKVAESAGDVEQEEAPYRAAVSALAAMAPSAAFAHFRKATYGDIRVENVQPFLDGRWVFMHNGTVQQLDTLGPKPPVRGSTDSEEFFHRWCGQGKEIEGYRGWVSQIAQHCPHTSLTSILSDGNAVMACRRVGKPLEGTVPKKYLNQSFVTYFGLHHWVRGNAQIICSEPLQGFAGKWRLLEPDECLLLDMRASTLASAS